MTTPALPASVDAVAAAGNNTMAAAGLANGMVKVFNLAVTDPEKAELASYQSAQVAVIGGRIHARLDHASGRRGRQESSHSGPFPSAAGPKTLSGHTGQIYSVVWSPDGKLVATAAADKSARIWDVAKAAQVRSLDRPEKVAYAWHSTPRETCSPPAATTS